MTRKDPGIYKVTIHIEVPVLFRADLVPDGTTWDTLRAEAANAIDQRIPASIRKHADLSALTLPGSGGFYPNGTEHDPAAGAGSAITSQVPVVGWLITLPKKTE